MNRKFGITLILTGLIIVFMGSCKKDSGLDIDIDNENGDDDKVELTETERLITGTWVHYRSAYDYYDCLTLNRDKTATFCRLEEELSVTSERFHERCYTWYVEQTPVTSGGNEYYLNLKEATDYTNAYIINTENWTMKDVGGVTFIDLTNKLEFDFCN